MPAKMFSPGARKAKPAPKQSMGKPARAVPMSGKPVSIGKSKSGGVVHTMPVGPKPKPGGAKPMPRPRPGAPSPGKPGHGPREVFPQYPLGPGSSNVEKGRISLGGPVIRMGGKPSINIAGKR